MKLEIMTPSGFQKFHGVKQYWHDNYMRFHFTDDTFIETSVEHKFIINDKVVYAKDVSVNSCIGKPISRIESVSGGKYFYDPVNVNNGKIYKHDDNLISHNTFFGTGDTLIEASSLLEQKSKHYIHLLENNSLRIYEEPEVGHEYIMMVDVAKGVGGDYSTFTLIDVTSRPFKQVAVYRNNKISPVLFPNIIVKYAEKYNKAYVVVENNDQGAVVCNGIYFDLEYDNFYLESATKATGLGITMNKKVKRLGCSAIKDIIENRKLQIVDETSIIEMSTFVAKGQSYEASQGNHDDLMMNLVLFGYFTLTQFFGDLVGVDMKSILFERQVEMIDDDVIPFGFIDDGLEESLSIEEHINSNNNWLMEETDKNYHWNDY